MGTEELILLQLVLGIVSNYFNNGQPPTVEQKAALAQAEIVIKVKLDADLAKAAEGEPIPAA